MAKKLKASDTRPVDLTQNQILMVLGMIGTTYRFMREERAKSTDPAEREFYSAQFGAVNELENQFKKADQRQHDTSQDAEPEEDDDGDGENGN